MSRRRRTEDRRCAIDYVDGTEGARLDRARIQAVVDAALAEAGRTDCALTVLLVDSPASDALHRQHFAVEGDTDVMTFPDGGVDPQSGRVHLGDLAVCPAVAQREADARGRSAEDELTLYVLHGLLHLLGHDDHDPADLARMWDAQRRLLATVGIALEPEPD